MRAVIDVLLLCGALLYQNTLAAHFSVRGVTLDLIAVLLCTMGIVQGWLYSTLGGLLCGLVMDSVHGMPGFYSAQYMAFGMMIGFAADSIRFDNWMLPGLSCLVAYSILQLIPITYLFFSEAQVKFGYALLKALASAAVTSAALLPVHWLFRMLHKWDVIRAPIFMFGDRRWD